MKSQKEIRKAYKKSERKKFMESLPMAERYPEQLPRLLDTKRHSLQKK